MAAILRTARADEFDDLMRFLDLSYGCAKNSFTQWYPHLYFRDSAACSCNYVICDEGRIVSNVGAFPVEVVNSGVRVKLAGIGSVASLPEERKKGHMTRLMNHVVGVLREQGYLLSALFGDRHRYAAFGWERAGLVYRLQFTSRSLDRAGVASVAIEERSLAECLALIERFHEGGEFYSIRPELARQVHKSGLRAWAAADGYAAGWAERDGSVSLAELACAPGREAGMIRAIRERTLAHTVTWPIPSFAYQTLTRLMPSASTWSGETPGVYRIFDLARLLSAYQPVIESRTEGVSDFGVVIGIREPDRVVAATIVLRSGKLEIAEGRHVGSYVELDCMEAVRLFLGGPPGPNWMNLPGGLKALLPLPIHIPPMDWF